MNALNPHWIPLVVSVAMAFGVAATASAFFYRLFVRRSARLAADLARQTERCTSLERDFAAVLACSRHLGDRLVGSERARDALQKQIDKLRHHQDTDDQLPVHHAMKLLDTGVALDEVVRICELSSGEAEILQSLARFRAAA